MASVGDDIQRPVYQSWVLHHQAARSSRNSDPTIKKWTRFWMTLHGNTLSFCSSCDGKPGDVVGTLTLTSHAELSQVPHDLTQPGFGFQLKTMTNNEDTKVNVLLFEKQNDCDAWSSLITGVIKQFHQARPNSWHPDAFTVQRPVSTGDYVNSDYIRSQSNLPPVIRPQWSATLGHQQQQHHQRSNSWHPEARNPSAYHVTSGLEGSNPADHPGVGPQGSALRRVQVAREANHRFYNDSELNFNPPAWFVECTREKAENILGVSRHYGNVLLRPCSSEPNTKYAVSYRTDQDNGFVVNHYAVTGSGSGFRIDIKHMNRICTCLSDVMQYFVANCGSLARPLSKVSISNSSSESTEADHNTKHFQTVNRMQGGSSNQSSSSDRGPMIPARNDYARMGHQTQANRESAYSLYSMANQTQANGESAYSFNSATNQTKANGESVYSFDSKPSKQEHQIAKPSLSSEYISLHTSAQHQPSPDQPHAKGPAPLPPAQGAPPPAPPPPPPPPPLPPSVLTPTKVQPKDANRSPQNRANPVDTLQMELQKELQAKLSKYRKGTYKSHSEPNSSSTQ